MPTREECKRILFKIGIKLGCSPNLMATRLLSEDDKQDMVDGLLSIEELECHVKAWMDVQMPDYAHGKTEPYRPLLGKFSS